ncbi:hypothetical protein FGO68_gene16419 [Halteria grandinella]|uniref:Uncharacterized protein n=1 Tax=Halteria grandinella TaxID=5974 RepID=A0A8J8P748_HALGN|nr:hypothetical protein FGO68_gene16419 [Halteria grandinella]
MKYCTLSTQGQYYILNLVQGSSVKLSTHAQDKPDFYNQPNLIKTYNYGRRSLYQDVVYCLRRIGIFLPLGPNLNEQPSGSHMQSINATYHNSLMLV